MSSRLIRLFVASTFRDFRAERDVLQRRVFPRLTNLCRGHDLAFEAVDLRWGVSEEASIDHRTATICLEEVRRSVGTGVVGPSLLVLLSSQGGSMTLPTAIEASAFEAIAGALASCADSAHRSRARRLRRWYRLDRNALPPASVLRARRGRSAQRSIWELIDADLRDALVDGAAFTRQDSIEQAVAPRSITELEVEAGLLSLPGPGDHCVAVFRHGPDTREPTPGNAQASWSSLLKRVRGAASGAVLDFTPGTGPDALPEEYLQEFEQRVFEALAALVRQRAERLQVSAGERDEDDEEHRRIQSRLLRTYVSRRHFEGRLWEALEATAPVRHPVVIVGASGCGKSALMAALAREAASRFAGSRQCLRFAGATRAFSRAEHLLDDVLPSTVDRSMPATAFRHWLAHEAGALILFLDAVDRIEADHPSAAVDWLPERLTGETRVVISVSKGPVADQLRSLLPASAIFEMPVLDDDEAALVVSRHLALKGRQLQARQLDALVAAARPIDGQALYLRLAAFQAARWTHEFEPSMPDSLPGMIAAALSSIRADGYHGEQLMNKALGLIAVAKLGLDERELLEKFRRDGMIFSEFKANHGASPLVETLPPIVWYRIASDLRELLTERAVDGVVALSFFHQAVQAAVYERLGEDARRLAHRELAALFGDAQLYPRRLAGGRPNARALRVLPYHLAHSGDLAALSALMADFDVQMARCQAGQTLELEADYALASAVLPDSDAIRQIYTFLVAHRHLLGRGDASWTADRILLQVASEAAVGHPVREAAEAWLGADHCQWFWLHCPWQRPQVTGLIALQRHGMEALGMIAVGACAVSWSGDGSICSWDLTHGRLLREFIGHVGAVLGVMSIGDSRIVSWGRDGTARCWDLASARELARRQPHGGEITAVHPLSGGRYVSISRDELTLSVWSLDSEAPEISLRTEGPAERGSLHASSGQVGDRFLRADMFLPLGQGNLGALSTGGILELDDHHVVTWSFVAAAVWSLSTGSCVADIDWLFTHDEMQFVLPVGSKLAFLAGSGSRYDWDWRAQSLTHVCAGNYRGGVSAILSARRLHGFASAGVAGAESDNDEMAEALFLWSKANDDAEDLATSVAYAIVDRASGTTLRGGTLHNDPVLPSYFRRAHSFVHRGIFALDDDRLCAWSGTGIDIVHLDVGRIEPLARFDNAHMVTDCVLVSPTGLLLLANDGPRLFDMLTKSTRWTLKNTLAGITRLVPVGRGRVALLDRDGAVWILDAALLDLAGDAPPIDFGSLAVLDVKDCEEVGYAMVAIDFRSDSSAAYVDLLRVYPSPEVRKRVTHGLPMENDRSVTQAQFRSLGPSVVSWSRDPKFHITDAASEIEVQLTLGDGASPHTALPFRLGPSGLQPFGTDRQELRVAVLSSEGALEVHAPYAFTYETLTRRPEFEPPSATHETHESELSFAHGRWLLLVEKRSVEAWDMLRTNTRAEAPDYVFVAPPDTRWPERPGKTFVEAARALPDGGLRVVTRHALESTGDLKAETRYALWHVLQPGGDVHALGESADPIDLDGTGDDGDRAATSGTDRPRLSLSSRGAALHAGSNLVAQWHADVGGRLICTLETGGFVVLLRNGQLVLLQAKYGRELVDLDHIVDAPRAPSHAWLARSPIYDLGFATVMDDIHLNMRIGALGRAWESLHQVREVLVKYSVSAASVARWSGELERMSWAMGGERAAPWLSDSDIVATVGDLPFLRRDLRALELARAADASDGELEHVLSRDADGPDAFDPQGESIVAAAARLFVWNVRALARMEPPLPLLGLRREALRRLATAAALRHDHAHWRALMQPTEDDAIDSAPSLRATPIDVLDTPDSYPEELKPVLAKALHGDPDAMFELGRSFGLGLKGLARDPTRAAAWYERSSAGGNSDAPFCLAQMHRHGELGGMPDEKGAVPWLEMAAERGNLMAQTNLGIALTQGKVIAKDSVRGRAMLEKSVAAGDLIANVPLALSYLYGDGAGAPRDLARATHLAAAGAGRGNAACARLLVALRHATIAGVQDDEEATSTNEAPEASPAADAEATLGEALARWDERCDAGDEAAVASLGDALLAEIDDQRIDQAKDEVLKRLAFFLHERAARMIQCGDDRAPRVSQQAVAASERLIFSAGRYNLYPLLGAVFVNHASMLRVLGRHEEAFEFQRRAVDGLRRIPGEQIAPKLTIGLADALIGFVDNCLQLRRFADAETETELSLPSLRVALPAVGAELALRLVRIEMLLTFVRTQTASLAAAAEEAQHVLEAWLGDGAVFYGGPWNESLLKLIDQVERIHAAVHGNASARTMGEHWRTRLSALAGEA